MGARPVADDGLGALIRSEQVDILYRHAPLTQLTNLVVLGTTIWFLWNAVPRPRLLAWAALVVLIVAVRLVMFWAYTRRAPDSRRRWHAWMTGATVCSGLAWGAAGVLFHLPESALALTYVTVILAGLAAGSIPSHSSWPPAQLGFAIPTMLPCAVMYLAGEDELRLLGLMCLVFLLNVLLFGRNLSRSLLESLRLRLENQSLVERLQLETAAAQLARQRAEEANVAKSRFLAAASHDLRQPLHAMNLFVEALRNQPDARQAAQVLEHLGASSQALEGLLNELLDMSKLEADLFEPRPRVLSLQSLFDSLAMELSSVAQEKGLELCFVQSRMNVVSDPAMLGRVLRNLVTNAIRYTDRGAVLVGCRRKAGGQLAVAVYDTGHGIAAEHHEAIFREFFQLGNPERDRRKGLGLGLAIVDGLCRVLGHRVSLKSVPGKGSAFFVSMPIAAAAPDEAPALPPAQVDLSGCVVMVIDDEPAILEAMRGLLGSWGCKVLTAESGAAAVRLARLEASGIPDVLVADYRLRGGETGAQAIAAVRCALRREVPAAIVTGDTAPQRLLDAAASGCQLLHKPLQAERVRLVLHALRQQGAPVA